MTVKIFDRPDIQEFLNTVSGYDKADGNPRVKQITHRIVSDLFKAIDDLNITPDEYWAGIAWLNEIGAAGQAGLISPGLGLDHFLDERLDAIDAALGIENPTPVPSRVRSTLPAPRFRLALLVSMMARTRTATH